MELGPNQRRLVDALRSGKYKKAKHCLSDGEGGFCCLGVHCDVEDDSRWSERESTDGLYIYQRYGVNGYWSESVLPVPLIESLGVHDSRAGFLSPIEVNGTAYQNIAQLNDSEEFYDHAQMADFIEANADKIFVEAR